jgi:hypothetical protein
MAGRLKSFVLELAEGHSELRFDTVLGLVDNGEPGVAIEILSDNLLDEHVVLTSAQYECLVEVGTFFRVKPDYWSGIGRE